MWALIHSYLEQPNGKDRKKQTLLFRKRKEIQKVSRKVINKKGDRLLLNLG